MTQIIVAALVAFFVSIFLTPVLIKRFSEGGSARRSARRA